jgi:hypothetical protein
VAAALLGGLVFFGYFTVGVWHRSEATRQTARMLSDSEAAEQIRRHSEAIRGKAQQSINELIEQFEKPRIPLDGHQAGNEAVAVAGSENGPAAPTGAEKKMTFEEAKKLLDQSPPRRTAEGGASGGKSNTEKVENSGEKPADKNQENPAPAAAQVGPTGAAGSVTAAAESGVTSTEQVAATGASTSDAAPPDVLKITFDPSRLQRHGIDFSQVVTRFLSHWNDVDGPVRIDDDKLTIEFQNVPNVASMISGMSLTNRHGNGIDLTELTDSVILGNSRRLVRPDVLRIRFNRDRLRENGLSFGQVVMRFLSNWNENGPVHVDNDTYTIEVSPPAKAANQFAGMSVTNRSGNGVELSELTETVTTGSSRRPTAGPRPAWVDEAPRRTAGAWPQVIVVGDYVTTEECDLFTEQELWKKTWERFRRVVGPVGAEPRTLGAEAARMDLLRYNIDLNFIRREIIPPDGEYLETVQSPSLGPMYRLHTLLEFTPQVDALLQKRWERREQHWRIAAVGTFSAVALGAVGLFYGLLKIDTWTKGYYTKRLFIVPLAIGAVIFLLALINS